jgi:hypothetical protein
VYLSIKIALARLNPKKTLETEVHSCQAIRIFINALFRNLITHSFETTLSDWYPEGQHS